MLSAAATLVVGGSCVAGSTSAVSIGGVNNQHFTFHPALVSVAVGDVVAWTNNAPGIQHTTTENYLLDDNDLVGPLMKIVDPPLWDSGPLAGNGAGTFSVQFCEAGTFSYHCDIHRFMRGTVEVS